MKKNFYYLCRKRPLHFTGLFIIICYLFTSCHQKDKTASFYFWRTVFHLDSLENKTIIDNDVKTLYVRFFDVDFLPQNLSPKPISPIVFDSAAIELSIVPVVYIRNRTFERLNSEEIMQLAKQIFSLVGQISRSIKKTPGEIQFDCDWTDKTKNQYFLFLKYYHDLSGQIVSATIRLHQVKYAAQTGIPPVKYGVLMYYNIGEIGAGSGNSIYEKSIAAKYVPSLTSYPLVLDIALPVFSWGLLIREGKVVKLLNKMNFKHFENDSNFVFTQKNKLLVKNNCFHGGYYFQKNDLVKIEYVSKDDLTEMTNQINQYSNHRIRNVIFYDLDSTNIILYDKNIFRQVLGNLN